MGIRLPIKAFAETHKPLKLRKPRASLNHQRFVSNLSLQSGQLKSAEIGTQANIF